MTSHRYDQTTLELPRHSESRPPIPRYRIPPLDGAVVLEVDPHRRCRVRYLKQGDAERMRSMYAEVSPAIVGSPKTIFSGHKCQTASGSLLRECRDRGTTFRLVVKLALDLGGPPSARVRSRSGRSRCVSRAFVFIRKGHRTRCAPDCTAPSPCGSRSAREASREHYAPGTEFQIGRIEMIANTGTTPSSAKGSGRGAWRRRAAGDGGDAEGSSEVAPSW